MPIVQTRTLRLPTAERSRSSKCTGSVKGGSRTQTQVAGTPKPNTEFSQQRNGPPRAPFLCPVKRGNSQSALRVWFRVAVKTEQLRMRLNNLELWCLAFSSSWRDLKHECRSGEGLASTDQQEAVCSVVRSTVGILAVLLASL